MTISEKVREAEGVARLWRRGLASIGSATAILAAHGWYGIGIREGALVAYLDGIRFEL